MKINKQVKYVPCDTGHIYTMLYQPEVGNALSAAVVLCPPLGIDYTNSFRGLRTLAESLCAKGFWVMHIDYLGQGNSSDIEARDFSSQFDSAINSIRSASQTLTELSKVPRVSLCGFRFGATLAAYAAESMSTERLVCWLPIISGAHWIRELTLLEQSAAIKSEQSSEFIESGGIQIDATGQKLLSSIKLNLINPKTNETLIVFQQSLRKHQSLSEKWSESSRVQMLESTESQQLLVDAHSTTIPHETLDQIIGFLRNQTEPSAMAERWNNDKDLQHLGINHVTETPYVRNGIFMIQSSSADEINSGPVVVWLNSGSNHNVGPHKIYVDICRALAKQGLETWRVDLSGLGETPVAAGAVDNLSYPANPTEQVERILESINAQQRPVILAGLCSGAYHSFKAAAELPQYNIYAVAMINPLTYYWQQGMTIDEAPSKEIAQWNWYVEAFFSPTTWRRLITGKINLLPPIRALLAKLRRSSSNTLKRLFSNNQNDFDGEINASIPRSLKRLFHQHIQVLMYFAKDDPGHSMLLEQAQATVKAGQQDNKLGITLFEMADHTFSRSSARTQLIESVVNDLKRFKSANIKPE